MNYLKKRRFNYLFIYLTATFLFLFLPSISFAYVGESIVNTLLGIPASIIGAAIGAIALVSNIVAWLSGALLNWVTSPGFISLDYTNPAHNEIIKTGLSITKNFVNLALVVVLVFIALSVSLRLKEYASEKTLIRLIVIALLVNFAPVICGLIVDASNIIMNYFLVGIREGVSGILTGLSVESVAKALFELFLGSLKVKGFILTKGIVMIILNFSIAFAFFLLAAIFILRYIAIWILVILAPLAFVSWILPATRKFWNQWWKQFIHWSVVGIPIAFFLFLAMSSFPVINTAFHGKMSLPGMDESTAGLLDTVFPYFIIVAMLYLGLIIGLSTSATGANSIITFAKTKGKGAVKWTGKKTWQGTKLAGSKIRGSLPEKTQRWAETHKTMRKWGEGEKGIKGWGKRALSSINPGRYARRGLGKILAGGIIESEQKRIKQTEKKFEKKRMPVKLEAYHNAVTDDKKIGIINDLIKEGQIDDAMDKTKLKKSAISNAEIKRLFQKAKKWESDKELRNAFPHLNATPTPEDINNGLNTEADVIQNRIAKMKPDDYKNISKTALNDIRVQDAILATAMGSHINKLIEAHGRAASKIIEEAIDGEGEERNGQKAYINPRLKKYFTSTAGKILVSPKTENSDEWNSTPPPSEKPTIVPGTETESKKTIKEKERTEPITVSESIKEKFKKK